MKLLSILFLSLLAAASAQDRPAQDPAAGPELSEAEQDELSDALAEAGSSPVEFLRAIEKHLAKYPQSPRRPELERAAARAAIEAKDEKRVILYGERVLERDADDLQVLERVTRALLSAGGKENSERALKYARHFEKLVTAMRKESDPGRASRAEWQEELDRGFARALVFQARATATLGNPDAALALALRSWEAYATAEAAREVARCYERTGKPAQAIVFLANAFTIADPRNTDAERARDRDRMGQLYRQERGSETGLGDLILQAYDRTSALLRERAEKARAADPNAAATSAFDFTVSALDGGKLQLSALKGKVVVFDFWATWCGPCRAQHPLYEQVKNRFQGNADVVFLSINTDEDREDVAPFVEEQQWKGRVYFEDGLSKALGIRSIPTTIVLDKQGQVFSRLNGFVPERFVDTLSERIRDAMAN